MALDGSEESGAEKRVVKAGLKIFASEERILKVRLGVCYVKNEYCNLTLGNILINTDKKVKV